MMEALAAVGLAGNIVQFVDFTCKLFDRAAAIHHSHTGSSKGSQNLEDVAQCLQELSAKLTQHQSSHLKHTNISSRAATHQQDAALRRLAQNCQDAANDLLTGLRGLRAKDPSSKWSSLRAALASTWKQSQIDSLEKNLASYRSQLVIQLQVMQDEKTSAFFDVVDDLNDRSRQVSTDISHQIASLRTDVQHAMKTIRADLMNQSSMAANAPPAKGAACSTSPKDDIPTLTQKLVQSESSYTTLAVSLALLDSLTFEQMKSRHTQIHEAHPQTNVKVFEEKIAPWLRSSESLFWISGKPGSGKSTLMKYIVAHPSTSVSLQESMHGQKPIIGSYFFWINGTALQRSQEGLLRSLLFELLRQSPGLIESTLPVPWSTINAGVIRGERPRYEWTRADLLSAIQRLAQSGRHATHFCVFIDGLDEYEGDHDELVEVIQGLMAMRLKMCVASRPWNVFEEAFGQDANRKLYMQDLNKPDIELYASDRLRNRREFEQLHAGAVDANEIIEEIVEKSQGVFLWVRLVVRSLIEGLRNHDRLSQLRKRLKDFPSDLEQFFDFIFQSLDPTYRAQTAHMFQVALHAQIFLGSRKTLTPLTYWFLDELEDDADMALTMPVVFWSAEIFHQRVEQMKTRINGRCKGLLEVYQRHEYGFTDTEVDFLHRTVKDFLMTTDVQRTLASWQHEDFDADLAICKASLAEAKFSLLEFVPSENNLRDYFNTHPAIASIFSSAKQLEIKDHKTYIPILDELELVVHDLSGRRISGQAFSGKTNFDNVFERAVSFDLTIAVRTWLVSFCNEKRINLATQYVHKCVSIEMVAILVSCGVAVTINFNLQHAMLSSLNGGSDNEILHSLRTVLATSAFEIDENGSFCSTFDVSLRRKLQPKEMAEVIQLNNRRLKEIIKEQGERRSITETTRVIIETTRGIIETTRVISETTRGITETTRADCSEVNEKKKTKFGSKPKSRISFLRKIFR